MNKTYLYKVARLTFKVIFQSTGEHDADGFINDEDLITSCRPFLVEGASDEPCCFTLTVDDTARPNNKGKEIGQFDCGGNNHGVYRLENGDYQIVVSDVCNRKCCLLQANADFSCGTVALRGDRSMRAFGLNNTLMMMFAFANAQNGTLLMHSSVIRKDGTGYLFLGVSGTGKSTHTQHWLDWVEGSDLMNDDNPVVRFIDGQTLVFGSPWSGKTPCYRNIEAPAGGFVQLKQAPYNKISRMGVINTFASILPSCSVMKWDKRVYTGICDTVGHVIETTPCFFLENLPDHEAVELSFEALTGKPLK